MNRSLWKSEKEYIELVSVICINYTPNGLYQNLHSRNYRLLGILELLSSGVLLVQFRSRLLALSIATITVLVYILLFFAAHVTTVKRSKRLTQAKGDNLI